MARRLGLHRYSSMFSTALPSTFARPGLLDGPLPTAPTTATTTTTTTTTATRRHGGAQSGAPLSINLSLAAPHSAPFTPDTLLAHVLTPDLLSRVLHTDFGFGGAADLVGSSASAPADAAAVPSAPEGDGTLGDGGPRSYADSNSWDDDMDGMSLLPVVESDDEASSAVWDDTCGGVLENGGLDELNVVPTMESLGAGVALSDVNKTAATPTASEATAPALPAAVAEGSALPAEQVGAAALPEAATEPVVATDGARRSTRRVARSPLVAAAVAAEAEAVAAAAAAAAGAGRTRGAAAAGKPLAAKGGSAGKRAKKLTYREQREKNNLAVRISREKSRQAREQLKRDNVEMRVEIDQLKEQLTKLIAITERQQALIVRQQKTIDETSRVC